MSYGGFLVWALQTRMMLVRKDSRCSQLSVAACILESKEGENVHSALFCCIPLYSIWFCYILHQPILLHSRPLKLQFIETYLFLTEHFSHFPSEVFRDSSPIWDIARVQKYSCLIKSSYVPGYVCLNWHLAVCSFFDSPPLFNTYSNERWLLLTAVWSCEVDPNSINNLRGCLHKRWSI